MDTSRARPARPARTRQNASVAEPTISPARPSGAGGERTVRDATSQHGTASADSVPADPADPSLIVRTLRAVADELERDPALASRVAAASGLASPSPPANAPQRAAGASEAESAGAVRPPNHMARAFQPRIVTGASNALGPGIPDPFALRARLGRDGLAAALAELRLGTLRAILREYALDPDGRIGRQNDASRIRAHIARAVESR